MSKRRSCSNKKSEDQMLCINVKGLDSLCGRDSEFSVDSDGSNEEEEEEEEEEDDEDYDDDEEDPECTKITIRATPCGRDRSSRQGREDSRDRDPSRGPQGPGQRGNMGQPPGQRGNMGQQPPGQRGGYNPMYGGQRPPQYGGQGQGPVQSPYRAMSPSQAPFDGKRQPPYGGQGPNQPSYGGQAQQPYGQPPYGGQQAYGGPGEEGRGPPQQVHHHGAPQPSIMKQECPPPSPYQPVGGPYQPAMMIASPPKKCTFPGEEGPCGSPQQGNMSGQNPCSTGSSCQVKGPCNAAQAQPTPPCNPQAPPAQPTPPACDTGNPTRYYSVNVTSCTKGLEKLEAKFEKKKSLVEVCCNFLLKTDEDKYAEDMDNICKTLKSETEKCIQNCPQEENRGFFATTMLMNSAAASELRKRAGTCTVPAWAKQN